jgi:hypothetical protein
MNEKGMYPVVFRGQQHDETTWLDVKNIEYFDDWGRQIFYKKEKITLLFSVTSLVCIVPNKLTSFI